MADLDSNTCPSPDALLRFASAQLPAEQRDAVEDHIDQCGSCRAQVAAAARDLVASIAADSADAATLRAGPGDLPPVRKVDDTAQLDGRQVGRYRIARTIGSGGMGTVCLAEDPELQRRVALKFLSPELMGARDTAQVRSRFQREGQAMAQLSHPHVVQVYDVGVYGGDVFLAMEYVDGVDLAEWLSAKRRSWREVLQVFADAGAGLAAAHAVGLVHRDFKPKNVLMGRDGVVKVTDFGLARLTSSELGTTGGTDAPAVGPGAARSAPLSEDGEDAVLHTPITRTGVMVGTPGYMSPEQIRGLEVDERGDIFSFCVALYEGLHGRRPFAGRDIDSLLEAIEAGQFDSGRTTRIPSRIDRAIRRGLRAAPRDRYQSMGELLAAIRPRRRRVGLAVSLAVGAAAASAAVVVALSQRGEAEPACTRGADEMSSLWNAEAKGSLSSAMTAMGAAAAWPTIERRLDEFAVSWAAMQRESCLATRVKGTQSEQLLDLRTACLQERRSALAETLVLLAKAKDVKSATTLVDHLPTLDRCADLEGLTSGPSLPSEAANRVEVLRERAKLARAEMLAVGQRLDDSRKIAESVVARAVELDYQPLRAEALVLKGEVEMLAIDLGPAEKTLREAIEVAEASRHDRARADAYFYLLAVLTQATRYQEARAWASLAEAVVARVDDDRKRAGLHAWIGKLDQAEGRFDDAVSAFDRSIALFERAGDDASYPLASAKLLRATALFFAGRFAEAYPSFEAAEVSLRELFGVNHPETIQALNMMAHARYESGEPALAVELWKDALARTEQSQGATHPLTMSKHTSIALGYSDLGQVDLAIEHARKAIEGLGGKHPLAVGGYGILAFVYLEHERYDEAREQLQIALELARSSIFVGDPETIVSLENAIGATFTRQKRHREAMAHYQSAKAICDGKLDPEHPVVANTLSRYSAALVDLGRAKEAVGVGQRALAIYEKRPPRPTDLASTEWQLARAMWSARVDRQRALALARDAANLYVTRGGRRAKDAKEIQDWIDARAGSAAPAAQQNHGEQR